MTSLPSTTSLFIEGLKMRPTAERVLLALHQLDGQPHPLQAGNTIPEIARHTGLHPHLIRARLCDLRRLGLVASEPCLIPGGNNREKRYAHYLTLAGVRRAER